MRDGMDLHFLRLPMDHSSPAAVANTCTELTLTVSAAGYRPLVQTLLIGDLRAQPENDFALMSTWRRTVLAYPPERGGACVGKLVSLSFGLDGPTHLWQTAAQQNATLPR